MTRYRHLLGWILLVLLALSACSRPERPTINLYRAIHVGDLDQIKRHIHFGTDLNRADANGNTPLHVAAEQGRLVIAKLLADNGARLDARDARGHTPLEVAVLAGKIPVARAFLKRGAALNAQSLLLEAIRAGSDFRDVYDFLVRQGADVNRPGADGQTPLLVAIRGGNRLVVKRLIDQGADVNRAVAGGTTPLGLAKEVGNDDIVQLLLSYGAAKGGAVDGK